MELTALTLALLCILSGNLADDFLSTVDVKKTKVPYNKLFDPCPHLAKWSVSNSTFVKFVGKSFNRLLCVEKEEPNIVLEEMYVAYSKDNEYFIGLYELKVHPFYKLRGSFKAGKQVHSMILGINDTRLYLADDDIGLFKRNETTGDLTDFESLTVGAVVKYIVLDPSNKFLLAACSDKGTVIVLPLLDNGAPTKNGMNVYQPPSPTSVGPEMLVFNPELKSLLAVVYKDLKKVAFFEFNSDDGTAILNKNVLKTPAFVRPEQVLFNKHGTVLYVSGSSILVIYTLKNFPSLKIYNGVHKKFIMTLRGKPVEFNETKIVAHPTLNTFFALNKKTSSISVLTINRFLNDSTAMVRGIIDVPNSPSGNTDIEVSPVKNNVIVTSSKDNAIVVFAELGVWWKLATIINLNNPTAILFPQWQSNSSTDSDYWLTDRPNNLKFL